MIVKIDKIMSNKKDLELVDRTDPCNVVASLIQVFVNYDLNKLDNFYEMLQYLMGDFQPISEMMKQNIKDRMMQNDKFSFIGKSYFVGATPENDYEVSFPYEIEVIENEYTDDNEGYWA